MAKDQVERSVKQSSGRIKIASGELPGDETAGAVAHDAKTGENGKAAGDSKDMHRAIERWADEGGA